MMQKHVPGGSRNLIYLCGAVNPFTPNKRLSAVSVNLPPSLL